MPRTRLGVAREKTAAIMATMPVLDTTEECPDYFELLKALAYEMKPRNVLPLLFICQTCNEGFTTADERAEHWRSAHGSVGELILCHFEGNWVPRKKWAQHLREKHGESSSHLKHTSKEKGMAKAESFCHLCNKYFRDSGKLTGHIQDAHSDRPEEFFVCLKCNALYGYYNTFIRHRHFTK
jgi:hypothetical protein